MTKTEHLQFLILMIPTFLILAAAAVSMADLALPASDPNPQAAMVGVQAVPVADRAADDRPAE
jgi:Na+-transporting methylmalonyl-CoA/oxaloacetate decarboxylase beta subunit